MDLRQLRFFLAVAREKSFVRAAVALHTTQPNLTRTIRALEDETGAPLFIRSSRGVTLTPKGERLIRRAEEITALVAKTQTELSATEDGLTGDIYLAAGETAHMAHLARLMTDLHAKSPGLRFHVHSADGEEVARRVDLGLADVGLVFEPFDLRPYDHLRLPWIERWGILVPVHHALARVATVTPDDLAGTAVIASRQALQHDGFAGWLKGIELPPVVVADYNLAFSAVLMTAAGIGAMITFESMTKAHTQSNDSLVFRPFEPELLSTPYLIMKKGAMMTPAVAAFWETAKNAEST